ncbi:MAG: hypothetical protein WCL25_04925 [bacterium]
MKKRMVVNILVVLLLGGSLFFALKYVNSLRERIVTLENQKQNLLQDLEKEKNTVEKLNIKNMGLSRYLMAARRRLNKSFSALNMALGNIEKLGAQLSIVKAENNALLEEKQGFIRENAAMKMKLGSVDELKKAIRELKRERRVKGNRGLLLKDGKPTSNANIKIEVIPVRGENNERSISAVKSK